MNKSVVCGVLICAILILIQSGFAEPVNDSGKEHVWNGTWNDSNYIMYIQQNGTHIQGIYQPHDAAEYDPGILDGSLSEDGKVFSGNWKESGVVSWILSSDKNSFSAAGSHDQIEGLPEQTSYEYNGTRKGEMQDPKNVWSGEWVTEWKRYIVTQDGSSVSEINHPLPGIEDEDGMSVGTVSDDGLSVFSNWTETGNFMFTLSHDGTFFNGTYTVDLSESNKTVSWNMTKIQ